MCRSARAYTCRECWVLFPWAKFPKIMKICVWVLTPTRPPHPVLVLLVVQNALSTTLSTPQHTCNTLPTPSSTLSTPRPHYSQGFPPTWHSSNPPPQRYNPHHYPQQRCTSLSPPTYKATTPTTSTSPPHKHRETL